MAKAIDPQSSMAALFGSRLRKLRDAAGLTQTEVGALAHVVGSRIAQLERATGAKPTLELTRVLDRELVADELLIDLWPYVYREAFPDWSQAFIAYSARARLIREYASHAVPGLLQTPAYARALLSVGHSLRDAEHLEERIAARLDRQVRLTGPDRPELWIILDESVLRRPVGDPRSCAPSWRSFSRRRKSPTSRSRCCPSRRENTARWAAPSPCWSYRTAATSPTQRERTAAS